MRFFWHCILLLFCCLFWQNASGQLFQQIKGQIVDKASQEPLLGVVIRVVDEQQEMATVSDSAGQFVLLEVPVGKHTLSLEYPGYQPQTIANILVTSGREVELQLQMQESSHRLKEQVVSTKRRSVNELALASVKTFDAQETERYAGSRGDPARMASNFAGVQGADDSRNDIIVRGNSPAGLLWRIEDVDLINPNHFAIPGTSGGPVSMLNNKTLATSDFLTGAFPAEYGNSISAAFDLKLRNGNSSRYQMNAQLGFLGTELMAEGPINKKHRSSFLVAYRYSTLQLFQGLHIKIGTESVPAYQDLTVKLHFPIGRKSELALFAIGGLSHIDLIVSDLKEPPQELYGESDRDQYFTSNTAMLGMSFKRMLRNKSFIKLVSAVSGNDIDAHHDKVFRDAAYRVDSLKPILGYRFLTKNWNTHLFYQQKINARNSFRLGLINNTYFLNYIDSSRQYPPTRQDWQNRLDYNGSFNLVQAYVEYKYRPSDRLSISSGLHAQYFSLNESKALEPRIAARWLLPKGQAISFAYGLHSVLQPLYQYVAHLPGASTSAQLNKGMGFTRSHHLVAGYDRALSHSLRMRTEAYYQYLFDIPVETRTGSSFSNINQGSSFSRVFPDSLKNTGTGKNIGLELTLEKSFSHSYYAMFTGTIYKSTYVGNDDIQRSTDYNGVFSLNILGGFEPKLSANTTLISGAKVSYAGGRRYSLPDVAASNAIGDFVVVDSLRNSERFPNYFRADLKLGIRINRPRLTHEIALDLVNIFGTKNVLNLTYSPELAAQGQYPFLKSYQLGFLPLFYYKIDFGWR